MAMIWHINIKSIRILIGEVNFLGIKSYTVDINLKKIFATVMLISIFLTSSGCSEDNVKTTEYDDIIIDKLEPVQLDFYAIDYGNAYNDEVENIMKEIESKLAGTINVKPKFHLINYEQYEEEIKNLVNAGKDIDAFVCYNPAQFADKDILMDITQMFPEVAPDYYKELMSNEIGEESIYNSSLDEKIYSVPSNNFDCPRYFIAARKDLVDKYAENGFETFEDYDRFLKNIKEKEPKLIPGVVFSNAFFDAYMKGNGYYESSLYPCSVWDSEGRGLNSCENTGEFATAYNMLLNWRKNDYAPKNPQAYYNPFYFSNGLLASQLIGIDEVRNIMVDKISNAYEYRLYPLYLNTDHLIEVNTKGIAIASCSKNADRVLMFIEWLHKSQENYDLFRYGVKDRNYGLDGENLFYPEDRKEIPYAWNFVTDFFSDYCYERTCFLDTVNYREVIKEASLKNVKTHKEYFEESMGINFDEEYIKLNEHSEYINSVFTKYNDNMNEFYKFMDFGSGIITPEDLQESQKEAGVDKLLDIYSDLYNKDKK